VPPGPGTIRGRVLHAEDAARAGGVEVLLYALPSGGAPGVRRATSAPDGTFAFEGVSNDPQTAYLIGARYDGVPYPGARVTFPAGQTEQTGVEVRIGEATADASAVSVAEVELRVVPRGGRLAVLELHRLENHGARTVYVPAPERGAARAAFTAALPAGATDFRVPLGLAPEGLVQDGETVRFFGPVYPSAWDAPASRDQGLSFEYALPAAGATELAKRFPAGAGRVVVLSPADAPPLRIPGAREDGQVEAEGRSWRRLALPRVAPGGALALSVEVPPMRLDPDAVTLREVRIFLELDDAALVVTEEHTLFVRGDEAVVGRPGEHLLPLHVPEGATDLRFDRALFERGLGADDEGNAFLDGPLPPGESKIEMRYHLPIADPDAGGVFARRFGRSLPLLSVFVADTGLRFGSERLHRRRPVTTPDRTYMHLEAFQVEPDETVSLSLAQLHARGGPPRAARIALVALAAAAAAGFLVAPLRRGRTPERIADEVEDQARHDREAVYAALRDLEHDHETAKVSDEDYATMRLELRARAAALLREQEAGVAAAAATPAAPARAASCPACGAPARAGDRFCGQCGAQLGDDPRREASA